jgi:alpha-ketoglutarate-dependent 2,4-dichlorophenoxyacetate dioxygenase
MSLHTRALHPLFGVEILDVDLSRPLDDDGFRAIRAALDESSLLLFRGQALDHDAQVAFSQRFGELETVVKANPGGGSYFAWQTNLDRESRETIPPEDRRMIYQKANYFWHTDSSFKRIPALCSLLYGDICPPEGGDTEFACMRAAWRDLSPQRQAQLPTLVAEHSLLHSRSLVDEAALTAEMKAELTWVRHPLARRNPVNGRMSVYVSAHASHIVGWPLEEGRALLNELTAAATTAERIYRHRWREGDLLIWDNRSTVHRATAYDSVRHKRQMRRTTVAGDEAQYRAELQAMGAMTLASISVS